MGLRGSARKVVSIQFTPPADQHLDHGAGDEGYQSDEDSLPDLVEVDVNDLE